MMSEETRQWKSRPDWQLSADEHAALEKFLLIQASIYAGCVEQFERRACEQRSSSLRGAYEEQAKGYRWMAQEVEAWIDHVRTGVIPGNEEKVNENHQINDVLKKEGERGKEEVSAFALTHIPTQELAVFVHALDAIANDLRYRASAIVLNQQATSKARQTAQRYREDEQILESWKQRLTENSTFSSEELHTFITFLMGLAYYVGGFVCNDLESNFPLPPEDIKRQMKQLYYEWIESTPDQDTLALDYPFTSYSCLLGYIAYRLNPEMERQLRLAGH